MTADLAGGDGEKKCDTAGGDASSSSSSSSSFSSSSSSSSSSDCSCSACHPSDAGDAEQKPKHKDRVLLPSRDTSPSKKSKSSSPKKSNSRTTDVLKDMKVDKKDLMQKFLSQVCES